MSELLLLRCVIDLLCVDWTVHSKRENMLLLSTDKNVLSLSLSCCLRVLYFLCVFGRSITLYSLQFLRRLVQTTTCTNFSHFSPLVVSCPAITLQYIETKNSSSSIHYISLLYCRRVTTLFTVQCILQSYKNILKKKETNKNNEWVNETWVQKMTCSSCLNKRRKQIQPVGRVSTTKGKSFPYILYSITKEEIRGFSLIIKFKQSVRCANIDTTFGFFPP